MKVIFVFTSFFTLFQSAVHAAMPIDSMQMPGMQGMDVHDVDPQSVYKAWKIDREDTLLEVNKQQVKRQKDLEKIFQGLIPGDSAKIKVLHKGKVEERVVKIPGKD